MGSFSPKLGTQNRFNSVFAPIFSMARLRMQIASYLATLFFFVQFRGEWFSWLLNCPAVCIVYMQLPVKVAMMERLHRSWCYSNGGCTDFNACLIRQIKSNYYSCQRKLLRNKVSSLWFTNVITLVPLISGIQTLPSISLSYRREMSCYAEPNWKTFTGCYFHSSCQ